LIYTKRQQQIIDNAIDIIANQGMKYLTTKNLAEKVGVTEPALYRHFKDKNEILYAILHYFDVSSDFVLTSEELNSLKALDKIQKFLFDRYKLFSDKPSLAKIMFSEAFFSENPNLSEKMLQIMHKHAKSMTEAIKQGQKSGEITQEIIAIDLFRMIFGSLRLIVNQWIMSKHSFDLFMEGERLWLSTKKLISTN